MKIVTVIGARPQFVKAATFSRAIAKHNSTINDQRSTINEIIIHTGQHFDRNMSDVFFEEMEIPRPNYFLEINSLSHGAMTGRMLERIEEVLLKEQPNFVLVYGDTNSTLAGALAAKKLHIKVVHVEAGLRSFNMRMPEEINRILTDRISDILCCPTDAAVQNLKNEGFSVNDQRSTTNDQQVIKTGDVMLDAALYYAGFSASKSTILQDLGLVGREFALCTVHRAENTDDPARLNGIFDALLEISKDMPIVLPLHPRTRKLLPETINDQRTTINENLLLIDPVGYFDMLELLKAARIVLTDSGGLQKEAFFFRKPCVTMRDETEWVETVASGWNTLAGADTGRIMEAVKTVNIPNEHINVYGNGLAAKAILEALFAELSELSIKT